MIFAAHESCLFEWWWYAVVLVEFYVDVVESMNPSRPENIDCYWLYLLVSLFHWLAANRNISSAPPKRCSLVKWRPILLVCHCVDLGWPIATPFCSCLHHNFIQFPQFISHSIFIKKLWIFFLILMNVSRILWWILIIFSVAGFLMIIVFFTCVHK